jgi:hypothetical protein
MPTEVVTCVSPTSVASDSSSARLGAGSAEPHHQPRWRYDTEAETSNLQPPSARTRRHNLRIYAAALYIRPVNTIAYTSHSLAGSYLFHLRNLNSNRPRIGGQQLFLGILAFFGVPRGPGTSLGSTIARSEQPPRPAWLAGPGSVCALAALPVQRSCRLPTADPPAIIRAVQVFRSGKVRR